MDFDFDPMTFRRMFGESFPYCERIEILLEVWPERVAIHDGFLAESDPQWVSHGDGFVRVTVSNADALYGFVKELEPGMNGYELLRGHVDPPTPYDTKLYAEATAMFEERLNG